MKRYHVYIMASLSHTMYIGVTNDLARRAIEHRRKVVPGFTSRYNVTRLVYAEEFNDVRDAIVREKQLKGWRRERKIALIESVNPEWDDLADMVSLRTRFFAALRMTGASLRMPRGSLRTAGRDASNVASARGLPCA